LFFFQKIGGSASGSGSGSSSGGCLIKSASKQVGEGEGRFHPLLYYLFAMTKACVAETADSVLLALQLQVPRH
jgi:hypothetical protein